jgi:hypothetical protein
MKRLSILTCAAVGCATTIALSAPASALTQKECSAKYEAAKKAGTLKGMKWNDFRKAECGTHAGAAAKTKVTDAIFPKAINAKYSKETPSKARLHTCADHTTPTRRTTPIAD